MEFSIDKKGNAVVVKLSGRLDAVTAPQFEKDAEDYYATPENNLVLDMTELDYVSSAGLRVILKIAKAFNSNSYDFLVCHVQDHVMEVFEMSGFEHFITIRETLADCL